MGDVFIDYTPKKFLVFNVLASIKFREEWDASVFLDAGMVNHGRTSY